MLNVHQNQLKFPILRRLTVDCYRLVYYLTVMNYLHYFWYLYEVITKKQRFSPLPHKKLLYQDFSYWLLM